jgi:hypothetical protein
MNCFFYDGRQETMGSTDLPWMHYSHIKNSPKGSVNCRVVDICHKFATTRAEKLVRDFGDCSFEGVNQKSSIITYVELEILDELVDNRQTHFVAAIFPCEAANYLVPIWLYE